MQVYLYIARLNENMFTFSRNRGEINLRIREGLRRFFS